MIADDRGSQIADDRKENSSKQNGGRRGINFAASKIILLLVNRF